TIGPWDCMTEPSNDDGPDKRAELADLLRSGVAFTKELKQTRSAHGRQDLFDCPIKIGSFSIAGPIGVAAKQPPKAVQKHRQHQGKFVPYRHDGFADDFADYFVNRVDVAK